MRMDRLKTPSLLLPGLALTWLAGCLPPVALPSPEELVKRLSYAILQPETTCDQLRADLGLEELPRAETPADLGISYEEHLVPVSGDATLRLWYLPGVRRRTVVVSTGNSGPMTCYLFTARLLHEAGYSVVMYDYRGFGGSSGEPALDNLRADLETVVDWTRARTGNRRVTLFGISLGGIPSVAVAVDRANAVNGVVLDSPVALGQEIERFSFLVRGRSEDIIAGLTSVAPWLITENIIPALTQPLLVYLHGGDQITPPSSVLLLYERASGPKQIVYFLGLDHAAGQFLDTANYVANLVVFLERVWS